MQLFAKDFFPTLKNNPELAYFDNAASTQTHQWVLDRMNRYYEHERCNIHRSDFAMSDFVAAEVDQARRSIANLINAEPEQIMFTSGATEGLNMVAQWHKSTNQVIITEGEHNSNIVPWLVQNRSSENKRLAVLSLLEHYGHTELDETNAKIERSEPGSLLSIASIHNASGVEQHWRTMIRLAHNRGIYTCLDACQSIMHEYIDVKKVPVDYMVFSGHKMFGPTGVGILYSRRGFADLKPLMFGGGGVEHVSFDNLVFYPDVSKHEVGTRNIAGILGLGIAAEFINYVGYDEIQSAIRKLDSYFVKYEIKDKLSALGFEPLFPGVSKSSIFSFRSNSLNPSDVSVILGQRNVAVRTGKLCAHPLVNKFAPKGLLRISTAPYMTENDFEKLSSELTHALKKLQ